MTTPAGLLDWEEERPQLLGAPMPVQPRAPGPMMIPAPPGALASAGMQSAAQGGVTPPPALAGEQAAFPGTRAPAPIVPPPTPPPPPGPKSLWQRVREGIATGAGRLFNLPDDPNLMSPDARLMAIRQGLIRAGGAIASADPTRSTFGALAQGISAGNQGAVEGVGLADMYQQRQRTAQMHQRQQAILDKYKGEDTGSLPVMQRLYKDMTVEALGGNEEAAKTAGSLGNVIQTLSGQREQGVKLAPQEEEWRTGPDGKPFLFARNEAARPRTGNPAQKVGVVQSGPNKGQWHWFQQGASPTDWTDTGLQAPAPASERSYRPVNTEREAANHAARAIEPQAVMVGIENRDPSVPGRLMNTLSTKGWFRRVREKFLVDDEGFEAQLFKELSEDEKNYFTASRQFLSGMGRGEIGSQQTVQEMIRLKGSYFPPGLGSERQIPALQNRRYRDIEGKVHQSGGDFESYWMPRLLADGADLSPYDFGRAAGGASAPPPAPAQAQAPTRAPSAPQPAPAAGGAGRTYRPDNPFVKK